MATGDRGDLTVVVVGDEGGRSRRFRIRRRLIAGSVLLVLGAALAVGYVLGGRAAKTRSLSAATDVPSPVTQPEVAPRVMPEPPSRPIAPAAAALADAVDAGALAAVRAEPQGLAAAAAAAASGEPLRFLRDGQGAEIEVFPFAADGSPNAEAFAKLETEMACGSGHSEKPDPALVRVLLAAQREFGKPLVIVGGRCAAHEDHPDTVAHHRAGRAADVRLRGVPSDQLMSWFVARGVGGAGRYKRASYLHVDVRTGPREHWEAVEAAPEKPKPRPADPAAEPGPAAAPAQAAPGPAAEPAAPAPAAAPSTDAPAEP